MGGRGSGRPPSTETIIKRSQPELTPLGNGIFIPNYSGDHSAGNVKTTPVNDLDLVNKKYVDDTVGGGGGLTTDLSVGTKTATTIDINSSNGTNATLPEADTTNAGILSSDKWDEIVANSNKTGITPAQTTAITTNSNKTGITPAQTTAITTNSNKTGITSAQTTAITTNSSHSADNTQAHSDYLLNNASDTTSGTITAAGFTTTGVTVTGDHGTAATDQVVNVCYGTGDPPTANTTTIGSLFVKYTA